MSKNTGSLRPLLPASSRDLYQDLHRGENVQRRRKVACIRCQEKRVKCVGLSPCQECAASASRCIFDPCKDKRRKIAWKNTQESLMQLINILRCGTDDDVQHLREKIQQAASPQHAVECLHSSFSRLKHLPE